MMNGKLFSGLACILVATCVLAFGRSTAHTSTPHPVSQTAPSSPKKAEEQFKNIQVLKGIPAEQIFPTMQFIAASLGVECDFCHVQNAFEKDDKKPKQAARKMMEMMFAINKDNFEGHREVTCYSCHRGSAHPLAIPTVVSDDSGPAMLAPHHHDDEAHPEEGKEKGGPTPEQLLDKYLQAVGGAGAIEKISSRVMTGTIDFGGKSFPIEIYAKDPEKRISITHMAEGESVTAFDGHDGWLGMSGRPMREMHGSDLDSAAMDADLHLATHFKQMFTQMRVQGTEKIGDREAYLLVGTREGKTPVRLYFDAESGVLVRLVRFGDTALGLMPTQIDYADYRDAGGVKLPYRWTLARPNGKFTIQVSESKQNVPIDDARFAKPPASAEQTKPAIK